MSDQFAIENVSWKGTGTVGGPGPLTFGGPTPMVPASAYEALHAELATLRSGIEELARMFNDPQPTIDRAYVVREVRALLAPTGDTNEN